MNLEFVYKICKISDWLEAKKDKKFIGTAKDKSDGYIHFSSLDQVESTLAKYYLNEKELILLKIKTLNLDNLIWEQSSDGNFFPHLYSTLDITNVCGEHYLDLNQDGSHKIPFDF
ncbi:DUF952 domain-containing protein [Candidatus Pelagibacter sp.]|nr:DUF952 domain-containing protein [Candidatus Pelagibacter sp.]